MRKRRVVGRIYGTKYSWKNHKDRSRHKNRIKKGVGKLSWFISDINRNIPATWRWAHGGRKRRKKERKERKKKEKERYVYFPLLLPTPLPPPPPQVSCIFARPIILVARRLCTFNIKLHCVGSCLFSGKVFNSLHCSLLFVCLFR